MIKCKVAAVMRVEGCGGDDGGMMVVSVRQLMLHSARLTFAATYAAGHELVEGGGGRVGRGGQVGGSG